MSDKPIPYIKDTDISNGEILASIYSDRYTHYYWSENFSPDFYMKLAQFGFISTAIQTDGVEILLPEMQKSYAVLHFKNLHISRTVKRLLKKSVELKIEKNLELFTKEIHLYHKDECWLTPGYLQCIESLKDRTLKEDNFEWVTVMVFKDGEIIAGELGYFIGKTYTSLTGFCNRKISGSGTLQMVLLAQLLENMGMDYWNMGHPYMDYKIKLGARIYHRAEFLNLWTKSIQFTGKSLTDLLNF